MSVTAAAPAVTGWDGPNDEWMTADETMQSFLNSFGKKDIPALRREGRVRHFHVQPSTHPVAALRLALEAPTITRWTALRDYTDRQLAHAAQVLDAERAATEHAERPVKMRLVQWEREDPTDEPNHTDRQKQVGANILARINEREKTA